MIEIKYIHSLSSLRTTSKTEQDAIFYTPQVEYNRMPRPTTHTPYRHARLRCDGISATHLPREACLLRAACPLPARPSLALHAPLAPPLPGPHSALAPPSLLLVLLGAGAPSGAHCLHLPLLQPKAGGLLGSSPNLIRSPLLRSADSQPEEPMRKEAGVMGLFL